MSWLALLVPLVVASPCEQVDLRDIVAVPPPAVVVLGVREGTQPDLYRASRAVYRLRQHAPVRLTLAAVSAEQQPVLDDYADREIEPEDLEVALDWKASQGFPFPPYARLLAHARHGVDVLGLEQDPTGPREVPVPAGYADVLRDAMAGYDAPPTVEADLMRYIAWRDHQLASRAVRGWDQEGYLVVVVDRAHVEGGKGVSWQVEQLVDVPVHAFVMAWAGAPCFAGDRVWHPGLLAPRD